MRSCPNNAVQSIPIMAIAKKFNAGSFRLIDWLILFGLLYWEFILLLCNLLGIAWWAKIKTIGPNATYWYGPFISNKRLKRSLKDFLSEISEENPASIQHQDCQTCRKEPYTIYES